MKIIARIIVYTALLLAAVYAIEGPDGGENDSISKQLTPKTQRLLKSHVIQIRETYFTKRSEFESTTNVIEKYLDTLEVRNKIYGSPKILDISIVSGGGRVSYFEDIRDRLDSKLKDAYVRCHIGFAGSIAFTFMIHFCDERNFYQDALVMQHQAYLSLYGFVFYNDNTIRLSRRYSDLEAEALGMEESLWWEISRMQGDKFFNHEEEKAYNLRTN